MTNEKKELLKEIDYWKSKSLDYARTIDDLMQYKHNREKIDDMQRETRKEYCMYYSISEKSCNPCP
jgi:hypothetical protein